MNKSCIGPLSHRGVGRFPRSAIPFLAALTLAGNIATSRLAREQSTRTLFDCFAGRSAEFVSRAPFFGFCVLLVVLWASTYFLVGNFDTYQLIINTPTTIITSLLVALLQNTQKRNEQALQHKLNAVADGLADLMKHFAENDPERRADLLTAIYRRFNPPTSR